MKRKKTIVAADDDVIVCVKVEVIAKRGGLVPDETAILLDRIVDDTMLSIKSAPYIYVPLSKMKVT